MPWRAAAKDEMVLEEVFACHGNPLENKKAGIKSSEPSLISQLCDDAHTLHSSLSSL